MLAECRCAAGGRVATGTAPLQEASTAPSLALDGEVPVLRVQSNHQRASLAVRNRQRDTAGEAVCRFAARVERGPLLPCPRVCVPWSEVGGATLEADEATRDGDDASLCQGGARGERFPTQCSGRTPRWRLALPAPGGHTDEDLPAALGGATRREANR